MPWFRLLDTGKPEWIAAVVIENDDAVKTCSRNCCCIGCRAKRIGLLKMTPEQKSAYYLRLESARGTDHYRPVTGHSENCKCTDDGLRKW